MERRKILVHCRQERERKEKAHLASMLKMVDLSSNHVDL